MDNEQILKAVFKTTENNDILAVVCYGKKSKDNIDVFLVVNKNFDHYRYTEKELRITAFGVPNINFFLNRFEPLVTEPVLTGEILYEKILKVSNMRGQLWDKKADCSTVIYLSRRAQELSNWAQMCYEANESESGLTNLVLSLIYANFARYYENHAKVITFKELFKKYADPVLKKKYAHLKQKGLIGLKGEGWLEQD